MNYIVRADFYPNGDIIPLGMTDDQGVSQYLKKVSVDKKPNGGLQFECLTDTGKKVVLSFSENGWKVAIF